MKLIKHLICACSYALSGFQAALRQELALKLEMVSAVIFIPLAFVIGRGGLEIAVLTMVVFFILMAELINTAIETVVDRISLEKHPQSKFAKDLGAALVLLSITNAIVVWACILWI